MNKIKNYFETIIPINRKEKFYTATIFPQIICADNFANISLFLELIPKFTYQIKISPDLETNNILFLTEYSLKEALVEDHFLKLYKGDYKTKETPDVVILITEPEYILILIEAKMFSSSNSVELNDQMNKQRWIVDAFKEVLKIKEENIFHIGLVPQQLIPNKSVLTDYHIVYWEEIVEKYQQIMGNNYFFNVLKIALKKFDSLSSKNASSGNTYRQNNEELLSGLKIVELHNQGKRFWVGRNYGLTGEKLANDKSSGEWRNFKYEVNFSSENCPNRNWFSSEDFVKFMQAETRTSNTITQNNYTIEKNIISDKSNLGDWHFSHLGEDYFLEIALLACYKSTWDVPIKKVFIGKKGEPYIKKSFGRNVNPNWCVVLEDGREFMCKSSTRQISKGLYDTRNCHTFLWSQIKEFFQDRTKVRKY